MTTAALSSWEEFKKQLKQSTAVGPNGPSPAPAGAGAAKPVQKPPSETSSIASADVTEKPNALSATTPGRRRSLSVATSLSSTLPGERRGSIRLNSPVAQLPRSPPKSVEDRRQSLIERVKNRASFRSPSAPSRDRPEPQVSTAPGPRSAGRPTSISDHFTQSLTKSRLLQSSMKIASSPTSPTKPSAALFTPSSQAPNSLPPIPDLRLSGANVSAAAKSPEAIPNPPSESVPAAHDAVSKPQGIQKLLHSPFVKQSSATPTTNASGSTPSTGNVRFQRQSPHTAPKPKADENAFVPGPSRRPSQPAPARKTSPVAPVASAQPEAIVSPTPEEEERVESPPADEMVDDADLEPDWLVPFMESRLKHIMVARSKLSSLLNETQDEEQSCISALRAMVRKRQDERHKLSILTQRVKEWEKRTRAISAHLQLEREERQKAEESVRQYKRDATEMIERLQSSMKDMTSQYRREVTQNANLSAQFKKVMQQLLEEQERVATAETKLEEERRRAQQRRRVLFESKLNTTLVDENGDYLEKSRDELLQLYQQQQATLLALRTEVNEQSDSRRRMEDDFENEITVATQTIENLEDKIRLLQRETSLLKDHQAKGGRTFSSASLSSADLRTIIGENEAVREFIEHLQAQREQDRTAMESQIAKYAKAMEDDNEIIMELRKRLEAESKTSVQVRKEIEQVRSSFEDRRRSFTEDMDRLTVMRERNQRPVSELLDDGQRKKYEQMRDLVEPDDFDGADQSAGRETEHLDVAEVVGSPTDDSETPGRSTGYTQQQIIQDLVTKLKDEETQRLRTEKQAARMMAHEEAHIKHLEGKLRNLEEELKTRSDSQPGSEASSSPPPNAPASPPPPVASDSLPPSATTPATTPAAAAVAVDGLNFDSPSVPADAREMNNRARETLERWREDQLTAQNASAAE